MIEPNGELRYAAATIRQMFLSFTEVGFTESQALELVKHILPGLSGQNDG